MSQHLPIQIDKSSDVSPNASIGEGTIIWKWVHIREGVQIGKFCIISKGVYMDPYVIVGNHCKIQNNVSLYRGVVIEDKVFIAPHVCFTNDMDPRATRFDGELRTQKDWQIVSTLVKIGATIGANCTIRCGVTIGEYSFIGAGSVVTKDVPPYSLVYGNPGIIRGSVCMCGKKFDAHRVFCDRCNVTYESTQTYV